jgi:hypothetical protein
MSEPENKSHWEILASELGAQPTEPTPPPAAPAPAASAPKRDYKPPAEPVAAKSDWNSLANLLGIQPAPEPAPAVEPVKSKPAPAAESVPAEPKRVSPPPSVAAKRSHADSNNLPELAPRQRIALPDDLLPRRIEPSAAEKAVGDLFGLPAATRDVAPAEERPATRPEPKFRDDFDSFDKSDEETSATDEGRDEGAPAEEGDAPVRRRRRRRRGRRGRGEGSASREKVSGAEAREGDDDVDADFSGPLGDDSEGDLGEGANAEHDDLESKPSEDGEATKPDRKRRRRGRGRRGRRKEGTEATADSKGVANGSAPAKDDFDEDDQFDSPNDIPLGGGADDSDDDEDRSDRSEHRNIPTWDEAIAIMIGVNMEARAKSPGGGRSSGPPRGRGRGGRGGKRS